MVGQKLLLYHWIPDLMSATALPKNGGVGQAFENGSHAFACYGRLS